MDARRAKELETKQFIDQQIARKKEKEEAEY